MPKVSLNELELHIYAIGAGSSHRSPNFVHRSNDLLAHYPKNLEEKRLLGAMIIAVPSR